LAGETEVFGENLLHCHTVYNKSNKHDTTWDQTFVAAVGNQQVTFTAMMQKSLF
jgi:hypothetical protein